MYLISLRSSSLTHLPSFTLSSLVITHSSSFVHTLDMIYLVSTLSSSTVCHLDLIYPCVDSWSWYNLLSSIDISQPVISIITILLVDSWCDMVETNNTYLEILLDPIWSSVSWSRSHISINNPPNTCLEEY